MMLRQLPSHRHHRTRCRQNRGFSLLELMIALVVVGILVSIALPSFNNAMRKSRRADAYTALSAVQLAQERWRANRSTYSNSLGSTGLNLPSNSPNDHYELAIDASDGTSYTVTASAKSTSSQSGDGNCVRLRLTMANGSITYSSAPATGSTFDSAANNPCWNRS
ncbi:MAG: type IV pilin protein [Rubrivivax sp.]|jgi:type IV pilus assembly protein PilE